MKNIKGNLFDQVCDAICITTNGFTKSDGSCVMGRGCAEEAVKRWPGIQYKYGKLIAKHGNRAMIIGKATETCCLVAFPVKPIFGVFDGTNAVRHMASKLNIGDKVPGWACKAQHEIITESAKQLVEMTDKFRWKRIVLPRPGCGAGELDWSEIEPLLQTHLDHRFEAITF